MIPVSGTVGNVSEYLSALTELGVSGHEQPWWFRGHRDEAFTLQASVYRAAAEDRHERPMLKRFMQDARPLLANSPQDRWDWLFLAQHHGVPTRLLDWSENALVGLYFAAESPSTTLEDTVGPDGEVWILQPAGLNNAGPWRSRHGSDLPMLGVDSFLEGYHPLERVDEQNVLRPVAALAGRNFGRILNQWGTFTISVDDAPLEFDEHADKFLLRLRVAATAKDQVLSELRYLGIQERTIYPDLHRLGARVKELFR